MPGCYYGENESVSDHAPVIYGEIATWNVSSPISHFSIKNADNSIFFNHKFHINQNGSLINREGERVGTLGGSEVFLLKSVNKKPLGYAAITNHYRNRMALVFKAIKKIFSERKDLNYMVLQEIPAKKDKTIADEYIHPLLNEFLKPEFGEKQQLFINFFNEKATKLSTEVAKRKAYKSDLIPDIAIISRVKAPRLMAMNIADYDNRFAPFCSKKNKKCFVSVHMPSTSTAEELKTRCGDLKNLAQQIINQGFTSISIAGDFNTNATRIANECRNILPIINAEVELHTTKNGAGSSCSDNSGTITKNNIDIMVKYRL